MTGGSGILEGRKEPVPMRHSEESPQGLTSESLSSIITKRNTQRLSRLRRFLVAPARHSSNKFGSALAYSQRCRVASLLAMTWWWRGYGWLRDNRNDTGKWDFGRSAGKVRCSRYPLRLRFSTRINRFSTGLTNPHPSLRAKRTPTERCSVGVEFLVSLFSRTAENSVSFLPFNSHPDA